MSAEPNPLDAGGIEALVVSYTVKELLQEINNSVTRIDTKLDSKASVESVEAVEKRVADNSDRLSDLELAKAKVYGMAVTLSFLGSGGGILISQLLGPT